MCEREREREREREGRGGRDGVRVRVFVCLRSSRCTGQSFSPSSSMVVRLETPEAAGELPYAQPADHPEHQMARPCF